MTLNERLDKLTGNDVLFVNPLVIECMMTGVGHATISRAGRICLVYEDGETETRDAGSELLATDVDDLSLFDLVSRVQAGRAV